MHIYGFSTSNLHEGNNNSKGKYTLFATPEIVTSRSGSTSLNKVPLKSYTETEQLYHLMKKIYSSIYINEDSIVYYLQELDNLYRRSDSYLTKAISSVYIADILNLYYNANKYAIDARTEIEKNNLLDLKEWSKSIFTSAVENYIKEALDCALLVHDVPFKTIEKFTDFDKEEIYRFKNQKASDLIYLKSIDIINNLLLSQTNNNYILYLSKNQIELIFNENQGLFKPDFCNNNLFILFLNAYSELIENNKTDTSSIVYSFKKNTDLSNILKFNSHRSNNGIENFHNYINKTYFDKIVFYYNKYKRSDLMLNFITSSDRTENIPLSLYVSDFYLSKLLSDNIHVFTNAKKKINENKITEFVNNLMLLYDRYGDNYLYCSIKKRLINLYSGKLDISIKQLTSETTKIPVTVSYKNVSYFEMTVFNERGESVYSTRYDLNNKKTITKQDTTVYIPQLVFGKYKAEIKPVYTHLDLFENEVFEENNSIEEISFTISSFFVYYTIIESKAIFVVTNSKTGKPEENVFLDVYEENLSCHDEKYIKKESYKTNKLGTVEISVSDRENLFYKVIKGADTYYPITKVSGLFNNYDSNQDNCYNILLDRAVYRPGQTINFKIFDSEYKDKRYIPARYKTLKVDLIGPNSEVVSTKSLITDNYGSIWGTFELPHNVSDGRFYIKVNNHSEFIIVESLKRPMLTINFEEEQKTYTWGDTIAIKGDVKTYSDTKISRAILNYEIRYLSKIKGDIFEIKQGEIETNNDGEFIFKFLAEVPFSSLIDVDSGYFNVSIKFTDQAGNALEAYRSIHVSNRAHNIVGFNLNKNIASKLIINSTSNLISFISYDMLDGIKFDVPEPLEENTLVEFTAYKLDKKTLKNISNYFKKNNKSYSDNYNSALCDSLIIDNKLQIAYHNKLHANKKYDLANLLKGDKNYIFKASYKSKETYKIVSIINENVKKIPVKNIDLLAYTRNTKLQYGENAKVVFGSSFNDVNLLCEIVAENGVQYKRKCISDNLEEIDFTYKKEYGESFTMILSFVKESKLYDTKIMFEKRSNELPLRIETKTFRNNLTIGEPEKWEFVIKRGDSIVNAQVLAALFDASINPYKQHAWIFNLCKNSTDKLFNVRSRTFDYSKKDFSRYSYVNCKFPELVSLNNINISRLLSYNIYNNLSIGRIPKALTATQERANSYEEIFFSDFEDEMTSNEIINFIERFDIEGALYSAYSPNGNIRKIPDETVFFYPNLTTDKDGNVVISFNSPKTLNEWDFNMLAVTEDLQYALYSAKIKTSKQLMVKPNIPLYIYDSEKIKIPVILSNLCNRSSNGDIIMELFNPYNNEILSTSKKQFRIESNKSKTITFTISAPKGCELLGVRFIGTDGIFSDGEQSVVPILTTKSRVN